MPPIAGNGTNLSTSRSTPVVTAPTSTDLALLAQRFWSKVAIKGANDCWLWQASLDRDGRGQISSGRRPHTMWKAHRVAWFLTYGVWPTLGLCHTCDDRYSPGDITYRACVNVAHMEEGDQKANMEHCAQVRRHHFGERTPSSKLSIEEVLYVRAYPRSRGYQTRLAAELNISQSQISRIILGKQRRYASDEVNR